MTQDLFNFVSWAEYVRMDGLNFSKLKVMVDGARKYRYALDHPMKQTPAMLLGNVIHKMVLEPGQFDSEYSIWQGGETATGKATMSKNTLAFKEFAVNELEAGRTVIDQNMVDEAKAIRASIMEHPVARVWIDGAQVEQTVVWQKNGYNCKSRIDIVQPGFICDLKTTVSADPYKFGGQAGKLKYHAQMAYYRDAWEAKTGQLLECKILAVEKTAPYKVVCYDIPEEALVEGQGLYENWMRELTECMESGQYPFMYAEEQELRLPAYMLCESLEAETSLIVGGKEYKI